MRIREIKRLDWVLEEADWWSAIPDAMFRGYEVRVTDSGKVRVRRGNTDWFEFTGTADEAKGMWQEDFEDRIRSCLVAPHNPEKEE